MTVSITIRVEPWVVPFVLLFDRLGCGHVTMEHVGRWACEHGMKVR